MSSCERLQAQLNSFLDGELDATHSVHLSAHLDECPECRRELAALRATQAMLRSAPVPSGKEAQKHALASLRTAATAEREVEQRRRYPVWRLSFASAMATMLLATMLHFYPSRSVPEIAPSEPREMVAMNVGANGLPTSDELDQMTSLHAAQSFAVTAGDDGVQQTTLADANSRLSLQRH